MSNAGSQHKAVSYPAVPYTGLIGANFGRGGIIHISGSIPNYAYRFDVSLQCGPQGAPNGDVAFQVSVDLTSESISLNCFKNGLWNEPEQRPTALKRGGNFEIILKCDTSYYKVLVNGQQYLLSQRVAYERITHVAITGNVSIHKITYGFESSDLPHPLPGQTPTHTTFTNHNLGFPQIPPHPVPPYSANSSFVPVNFSSSGHIQTRPYLPNNAAGNKPSDVFNSATQPILPPNSAYPSKNMNFVQASPYIDNLYSNALYPNAGFDNPAQPLNPPHPPEVPPGATVYYPVGYHVPGTSLHQPYGAPSLVTRREVSECEECADCLEFCGVKKRKRWFGIAGVTLMIILIIAIVVLMVVRRTIKHENRHVSTTHHRIDHF